MREHAYEKLCLIMGHLADNVKDAQSLSNMLMNTDWEEIVVPSEGLAKKICYECKRFYPSNGLQNVNGYGHHLYCPDCRILCPSCLRLHVSSKRYRYLYPLCDDCGEDVLEKVGRDRIDIEARKLTYQLKRASDLKLPATLRLGGWIGVLEHFLWKCAYCQDNSYEHMDHFLPLKLLAGGTSLNNCVPACQHCNCTKSKLHPDTIKGIPQADILRVKQYLSLFT